MNLRFTYSIIPVKSFATTRKPGNSCMTELLIPPRNRRTSTVLLVVKSPKGFYQLRNGRKGGFFYFNPQNRTWEKLFEQNYTLNTLIITPQAIKLISVVFTVSGSSTSKAGNSNTSPYWKQRRKARFDRSQHHLSGCPGRIMGRHTQSGITLSSSCHTQTDSRQPHCFPRITGRGHRRQSFCRR